MVEILNFQILDDHLIRFDFNDGTSKTVNFKPFIGEDSLTKPLADPDYFRQAKLYDRGRGIYWPNEYDVCPDFLRDYAEEVTLQSVA